MSGPSRPCEVEVGLGELGAAGERRALGAVAADQRLLLAQAGAVPGLDVHVDPAGDQVGAAGQPGGPRVVVLGCTQTNLSMFVGVLGLEVGGAVLEAEQVARRWPAAVEVEDVRPKPSWAQRMATVPKPIRARLRIACTATCGSWAQAWTHRSPLLRAGSRLSAGKCGSSRSAVGLPVREPEAVLAVLLEQGRAEAEGQRQARRRSGRGPRRCRSAGRRTAWAAPSPTGAPAVISRGRGRPLLQQRDQLVAGVGGDVEGGEVQPVLGRGGDAGLVRAVEGVGAPGRPRRRRLVGSWP